MLVAVIAGLAALIIPGVVLAVLLTPVFPLLAIEGRPVRATLRRSCQLVRHEFAATLMLVGGVWALTQLAAVGLVDASGSYAAPLFMLRARVGATLTG